MFHIKGVIKGQQRAEQADSIHGAMTWVEEYQHLGATTISVSDEDGNPVLSMIQDALTAEKERLLIVPRAN